MRASVVLFDLGDTLGTHTPSYAKIYHEVCQLHNVHIEEAAIAEASREVFDELGRDTGQMVFEASREADAQYYEHVNRKILARVGVFDPTLISRIHSAVTDQFESPEHFTLFTDTLPTLKALRSQGYRIGLVSNWSWNLVSLCERLALAPYFEHIVASSHVGAAKPHPKIFQFALNQFLVAPYQAVYVGNDPIADIAGATAVGIHTILIDRYRKIQSEAQGATIPALSCLSAKLDSLNAN